MDANTTGLNAIGRVDVRTFVAATLLLLPAACGQSASAPAAPTWPQPIDRANRATWYDRPIDVSGIDPAWRGEVRQATITITPPNGAPVVVPRTPAALTSDSGVYQGAAADGSTLELRLQNNWCNLHSADPLLPFTVEARLTRPGSARPETLRGCGAQVGYRTARVG